MSIQLIVYPQSFQGLTNSSNTSNQFFVDGTNFNTVNTSPNTQVTTNLAQGAIDYYNPIMSVNTWYRYYDVDSTNVYKISTFLRIIVGAGEQNGIIQKLSNLTIGAVYNITINTALQVGTARLLIFSGTVLQSTHAITSGVQTYQFTANSASDTLLIDSKYSTLSGLIQIESIGITAAPVTSSGAIQLPEDGQVICDLYEDEDLPLTLSVDDFKNVAEKVQSYSKAFNLPATKRNNKIFDHIFEITRDVQSSGGLLFNPYKKTVCVLKQDGFILFQGYLRMLDITDKNGEISYNVNLYSEVVALADTLKDRTFRNLDFDELSHLYNKTQIQYSWNPSGTGITYLNANTSGFRNANSTVKYPFVDWDHQILIGPGTTGLSANANNPRYTSLEQIFRPFINIKYIIDRIFQESEFTYESDFFNTDDFKKLYMDFNWGANDTSTTPTIGYYNLASFVPPVIYSTTTYQNFQLNDVSNFSADLNYDSVNHRFEALNDNTQYNLTVNVSIEYASGGTGANMRLAHKDNLGATLNTYGSSYSSSGYEILVLTQNVNLQQGDTLQVEFKSDVASAYRQNPGFGDKIIAAVGSGLATTDTLLQNLRGETGQWEFLKGLITMFNLVTLPDEDNPNNIKIEPYADVFITPSLTTKPLNWTDKIDVSEMKLTPLTDLNKKTMFKFVEDDDDFPFNNYKNLVGGHLYGSLNFNAGNQFNILDGEDEIIAEPFAATVIKPLMSQFHQFITPAIYAMNEGNSEAFENSPRIMYDNGIKPTGASYYIPEQNGLASDNLTDFLQFSHLSDIPTITSNPPALTDTRDFHFGICQLLTSDAPTVNNLFNMYWLPYYAELYNPNTRTMTIKVNLSPADINTFKFNSTVFIKNRVFRVNKINYKPNDLATVEFILIP